jgi:hypothetical protein
MVAQKAPGTESEAHEEGETREPKGSRVEIGPEFAFDAFIVNIAGTNNHRFLKCIMSVEFDDKAGVAEAAATRSIAGRIVASEASAPEIDLAARSRIGSGGASMLVSKDPLMYPLIRYLSRYCPPEVANAILARTMYLRDSPELSIPLRKADCASKTRAAPTAEPRKSDRGISLCLANIRTT